MNVIKSLVSYCPSPELLNLIFGLLASVAINILTTLALSTEPIMTRALVSGLALLGASLSAGALALTVGRLRTDALSFVGPTLTDAERRAEVGARMEERGGRVVVLELITFFLAVIGLIYLLLAVNAN